MIAIGLLIALGLFLNSKRHEVMVLFLSLISTSVAVSVIKELVMRVRPENALVIESGYSFPSGHAAMAAAFFLALAYIVWPRIYSKLGRIIFLKLSIIAILIMGISRLILAVHWGTDVVAGWFLGAILVGLSIAIAGRWRESNGFQK